MRSVYRIISLMMLLALVAGAAPALAVQADTVTRQCTFEVSTGREKYITDGDMNTAWSPSKSNAKLMITLPANGAGYVCVEWESEPTGFIFAQYDADQKVLTSVSEKDAYAGVSQVFALSENARYVLIALTEKGQGISGITVYSAGDLPASVQRWHGAFTKCDIMLVAAQPGDEFLSFGGLLPYYVGERGANVQLVYMTGSDRALKGAALDALWAVGISNYPEFMELKGSGIKSLEGCLKAWGGKDELIGAMVERIRRCKPEVIISHDISGSDGDHKRTLTAMLMEYAIEAAADANQYAESAELYGAWQVKKLYLNMGAEGVIDFDWNAVYDSLNGTPLEAARAAFDCYSEYAGSRDVEDGGMIDNSVYGLVYSGIGEDNYHDDVFENIASLELPRETEEAEPTPTPDPTFVPALVFSPEPTETARAAETGAAEDFSGAAVQVMKFVGIGLGAILAITCIQALIYRFRRRRRRRR